MRLWVARLRVLVEREARGALTPFALLLGGGVAATVACRLAPGADDSGVLGIEYQVLSLLLVTAVAGVLGQLQAVDLTGGRDRHLLTFPVTPVQVLTAKALVTASAGLLAVTALNAAWLAHSGSGGELPGGVPFHVAVVSEWLALMPIWATLLVIKRIRNAVAVLVIALLFWLNVPPLSLGGLLLPAEAQPGSLPLAGLTAVLVMACALAFLERHLALRTVG